MPEKILITSALLYANGPLHFGHIAGAYLPADCYARFQRLSGNDVFYVCGSDEYGVAITLSAEMAGRSPRDHVDHFHAVNKKLFERLNFSFDHYSRTTWEGHVEPSQRYFSDLLENGYIKERVTDQLYSEKDQRFLADRYVVGTCPKCGYEAARGDECPECGASYEATDLKNPRSKMSNAPLTLKPTKNWFLLLDQFRDRLLEWVATKNWKPTVTNFVKNYIEDLHPRAITRDSKWGVPMPLPDTEGKVLYVWFEAPVGYISATKEWAELQGTPDRWKDYWLDPKTTLIHFIGKDNIPFHAIIFPAMTMGQNTPYKLADEIPANEFYRLEGKQFSKSEGWFVDLEDFLQKYTADQIRYAIAANAPETSDSEFTWKDFQARCNSELLGKYGNLINRVLTFAHSKCGGRIPPLHNLEQVDEQFLADLQALVERIAASYQGYKLRRAAQLMMELAQLGNVYFDTKAPWKDAKAEETHQRMETTIACCLECLKLLALTSFPIIPSTASRVWHFLGYTTELQHASWSKVQVTHLPTSQKLNKPQILFQKIEDTQIEEEIAKLHAMAKTQEKPVTLKEYTPLKKEITFEDFQNLDLRVGTVTAVQPVPKSKKLLQVSVDLGFEQRTVVAGIGKSYQPNDLIGKKVVVVANLKPAELMGVKSQGMILAASANTTHELISLDHLPNGAVVS